MFDSTTSTAPIGLRDALDVVEQHLGTLGANATADGLGELDTMAIIEQLGRLDRHITALVVLIAPGLPDDHAFRATRDHSASRWLARVTGTSVSAAGKLLDTATALPDLPLVEDALRSGSLSATQVGVVLDAVSKDPNSEAEMVDAAGKESLHWLRSQADRVKAAAAGNDAERHRKAHKRRRLGLSTSPDSIGHDLRGHGSTTDTVLLLQALRMFIPDLFKAAKAAGEKPTQDQLMWDALIAMARNALGEGPGPTSGGRGTKVIVGVDYAALLRGEVAPGERCELVGVGPIPVAAVKDLIASGDVFLAAVIKHMKQVIGVTHFGRTPTAFEVTALEFMNPQCVVEGCDTTFVEHDHEEDWYLTKQTSFEGMEPMCPADHRLKTHHGWRLVEGTGRRPFVPPGHPDHRGNPQYHPRRSKPTQ